MSARTTTALEAPLPVATGHETPRNSTHSGLLKAEDHKSASRTSQHGHDTIVRLQYLQDIPLYQYTKPIQVTPPFPWNERTNIRLAAGPNEVLNDVRGHEHEFTLDDNGFCYVNAPIEFSNWSSQPAIAKEFLPEMEDLLKREIDGCDEIIFYDARIRQESDQGGFRFQGLSYNPFARQVHVDNTEVSIIEKIRSITEMKADYHLSGRARVINIWRPIKHPVYDCGLAIADGGQLTEDDVIECDRIRQDTGQYWDTMGVIKYRPGFKWYYKSLQDEPDVLLFKNYDSAKDVPARLCLHTAFDVPEEEIPANAPTRESIEVRALVFTHPTGMRRPSWTSTPHPLAELLEQSSLTSIDEEHSIVDRLRTDIDEGKEVKDAQSTIRRLEIRRLERVREALVTERDELQRELKRSRLELEQARVQINIQSAHAEAQQAAIAKLEQELSRSNGSLRAHVRDLSKELADVRMSNAHYGSAEDNAKHDRPNQGHDHDYAVEHEMLLQRIECQRYEIERWRGQAMQVGHEAISRSWQASVDEAVRREREKDAIVIKSLQAEIDRLRQYE